MTNNRYHHLAWLLWLCSALLPTLLTRNPLYLSLVLGAVWLIYTRMARHTPTALGWIQFLRLGVMLIVMSILFNILFVRVGATHLFTLPEWQWETTTTTGRVVLFQIGGRVSLESLVYGLCNGLNLLTILLIFATFNMLVDHYRLLRSMPNFLYQSAIVLSIALTFIPQMMTAQQEIREAQAIRGHRFRGLRDLLPLFVTLLAEGLERSLTLAESMEARGFASAPTVQQGLALKGVIALSLLIWVVGAFTWSYFPHQPIGAGLLLVGTGMVVTVLWFIGRRVKRSNYRRTLWRHPDTLVAVTAGMVLAVVIVTWLINKPMWIFYPYPRLSWPPFNPIVAATLLMVATPAFAQRFRP